MVWVTTVVPRVHRYSWRAVIATALTYSIFAWAWSLAITFGLYLAIPRRERGDALSGTLRTSATAVWFAPAIILLTQLSPAALAAALVLVVSATRLLYSQWRILYPPEQPIPLHAPWDLLFGEGEPPRALARDLAPALAVALFLQAGGTAIMANLPLLAGSFLAMGASMLTVFAMSSGVMETQRPRDLPRSLLGVLLTLLLASGMTIGGMSGRVMMARGRSGDADPGPKQGPVDATRALLRELFYHERPENNKAQEFPSTKEAPDKTVPKEAPAAAVPDGSYPGVILVSEERPVTRLVAPVTPSNGLTGPAPRPYSILFGGEYWMYRFLYRKPPANSFLRKGSPAGLSFSTTDHWPLLMEAHQKLDQPIDLNCCSKVQVEVWNADRYPGTVWLELFALDGDAVDSPARSFGSAQVQSAPNLGGEPVAAVAETLEFTVPEDAPAACGEFKVVFRRDRGRMDKSARVAIERFVLVPKGQ
jgi:hypothetical protein